MAEGSLSASNAGGKYEFHPLANLFPMLEGGDLSELVQDIREHGLQQLIVLHDGLILDGRNRYVACEAAGVPPRFRPFSGDDPIAFVVSANLSRRHLTATQKAFVALAIERIAAEDAKLRRGGDRKSEEYQSGNKTTLIDAGKARDKAASAVGASPRYVSDAKKIAAEDPKLAEECRSGKATITQAKRTLKERRREARRENNRQKIALVARPEQAAVSAAKFATIVIDPPWDWGDEGDQDQLGRARPDYGTMSLSQLLDLPVGDMADEDCHLYLWITNRSLPKGFQLIDRWGFRYVTTLTWVKPHFGMGNYFRGQTEHVLFAVKGSQQLKRKDLGTVFHAPRGPGGHSSKPVEFYDLVESASPGPYLEMFSRCERADWTMWGEDAHVVAA